MVNPQTQFNRLITLVTAAVIGLLPFAGATADDESDYYRIVSIATSKAPSVSRAALLLR